MSVESDGKDANCVCDMCRKVIANYCQLMRDHTDDGFRALQFYFSGNGGNHYCQDCMKIISATVVPNPH